MRLGLGSASRVSVPYGAAAGLPREWPSDRCRSCPAGTEGRGGRRALAWPAAPSAGGLPTEKSGGMFAFPPQINNKTKTSPNPLTGLVSRVTQYRYREGDRSSQECRRPRAVLSACPPQRGQEADDGGRGSADRCRVTGRGVVSVVLKPGIRVFFFKQTWNRTALVINAVTGRQTRRKTAGQLSST